MLISLPTLFNTCSMSVLFFLVIGALSSQKSSSIFPKHHTLIKFAFMASLAPTMIILANHTMINNAQIPWLSLGSLSLTVDFRHDIFSTVFSSIALFITFNMVTFSQYYMSSDRNLNLFTRLLTIFLLAMMILISSNNLFQLLMGWEGVGFLSFLLINWWSTRSDANTAALQAIMYNRIGDIGILLSAGTLLVLSSSWNLDSLFLLLNSTTLDSSLFLLGCLMAATGKSAQFGLHPWLPSAMEGPTPVSALLHSSTMVVAGVFLLIRVSPIMALNPTLTQMTLLLGALTAFFASTVAITQHDIKKIMAFSTTSQLGLMIFAMGLNLPVAAFFHMCTHGFFKAMLFLCSGSIIHNTSDEQDLRKIGGITFTLPMTSACLTIGSLALFGIPFLAGFYSKDIILESANFSPSNFMAMSLAIMATTLTATYSARIMLSSFSPNITMTPVNLVSEEQKFLTSPMKQLAMGAILAGWALAPLLQTNPSFTPLPSSLKTMTLTMIIMGLTLAVIFHMNTTHPSTPITKQHKLQNFLTTLWHFPELTHLFSSFTSLYSSQRLLARLFDQGWGEQVGAQGIGLMSKTLAQKTHSLQTGLMKQYMAISISTLILILLVTSMTFML